MSAGRVDPGAARVNYGGMSVSSVQQLLEETDVPLLRGLSKRDLRRIAKLAEVKRCLPGATIFRAGARGDAFYIIVAGNAEARMPDGSTEALHAGDYFGELSLVDGAPRAADVVCMGELTVVRIERRAFLELLREEPGIALVILTGVVGIVRALQVQLDVRAPG
ncbi:MAG TPA: cyclic nucleotide-binding domain-containing protein [Thermoleophilia bacterium]|nr:cyclic nucleotide-binding domain-containing protein [Thermoleophilia bacterium]